MSTTFTASHRGGSGPPLVLIHGFTDTWRTWELVLPALERHHDVLAVTLPGHAGGPALNGEVGDEVLADGVERAMDEAGFDTAHVAGNSLGGFVALQVAARGRARSVVAFAPAGGWAASGSERGQTYDYFRTMHELVKRAAPYADAIAGTPEGRRRATEYITARFEHIPSDLIAHQIRGAAACDAIPLIDHGARASWDLDLERITCPVRVVWGTADRLLPWPSTAARLRDALPQAEWVEMDGIGHSPQLDAPLEAAQLILGFTAG